VVDGEDLCPEARGWKEAYQFEHEEHKKTILMLQKTMEESDRIFVNTRDMIGFMERLAFDGKVPEKVENRPIKKGVSFE